MRLLRKLKDTAISAYISTNKIQENLSQVMNNTESDIRHEQQIKQQQQINLLSKKRFYHILERLDDIQYNKFRDGQPTSGIRERSFINKKYESLLETVGGQSGSYHLKTNNLLGMYASHANFIIEDNQHVLEFVVNTTINPIVRTLDLSNLTRLTLNENGKTYSFNTLNYLGTMQTNPYEISLYFLVQVEKFGEYDFELDDEVRILDSRNTPPKDSIMYNPKFGL